MGKQRAFNFTWLNALNSSPQSSLVNGALKDKVKSSRCKCSFSLHIACIPAAKPEWSECLCTPVTIRTSVMKKAGLSWGPTCPHPFCCMDRKMPHWRAMGQPVCAISPCTHTRGLLGALEIGPVSLFSFARSHKRRRRERQKYYPSLQQPSNSYVRLSDLNL